jgi:hypothetical protein
LFWFVTACYEAVGIIGPSAQVAYPAEFFSPANLYQDATFGWLLGYRVPMNGEVPQDDPVFTNATLWRDIEETPWWEI